MLIITGGHIYWYFPMALLFVLLRFFIMKNKRIVIKDKPDPTLVYITRQKKRFLRTYGNYETISSNIEKEFYNKDDYNTIMKKSNNKLEISWKRRIMHETTPQGVIVMSYDAYKQGFSYYCDTRLIPMSILNAVAMKYVLIYHCRDFYNDEDTFLKEQDTEKDNNDSNNDNEAVALIAGTYISPIIKIHEEKEKTKDSIEFAKNLSDAPFIRHNKKITKDVIKNLPKKLSRNKFIHVGKIYNFPILQNCVTSTYKTSSYDGMFSNSRDSISSGKMSYKQFKNK